MSTSHRPRLAPHVPVLRRPDGSWQVGLHRDPVLLPDRMAALLRVLDGRSPRAGLPARSGLPRGEIDQVLQALAVAGHLRSAEPVPPAPACLVLGDGPVADGLVDLLATGGRQTERIRLRRRLTDCADVLARRPCAVDRLTLISLGSREADRAVLGAVHDLGGPYLVIDSAPDWVRVGPLVLPGSTPCPRCTDLHRCDRDPDWPWLAAQLARPGPAPGIALQTWALGQALSQLGALAVGEVPTAVGGSTELDSADWLPVHRFLTAHPACSCGAASTVPPTTGDRNPTGSATMDR